MRCPYCRQPMKRYETTDGVDYWTELHCQACNVSNGKQVVTKSSGYDVNAPTGEMGTVRES
jgi:hypothetical protein